MTVKKKKLSDLQQLISDVHSHSINYDTREVYLHGAYSGDEEPGVEYRMATTFIKNMHILDGLGHANILCHLHSIGGEWGDGMAIFHTIRQSRSAVTMLAYAQASSISGVILQAADKRVLMPDTDFMIHHGSINASDNSMVAKSIIDSNEKAMKRMLHIFAERAIIGVYFRERNYTVSKIKSWLDKKIRHHSDWYMTSSEAVHFGFADGILGEKGFENINKIRAGRKWKASE
jgi:ATP-dependent protease ClpP protease subunit